MSYPNYPSASVFKFCDFKTTRHLNENQTPFAHISIWDNYGINIWGSNFEYAAGNAYAATNRGLGIFSIDANYQVNQSCETNGSTYPCPTMKKTEFRNLFRGVWVANSNIFRGPNITNTNFYGNNGDGIYMQNSNVFSANDNFFQMSDVLSNGVYLNTCQGYNLKNNTLTDYNNSQTTTGIYVYNSQGGAHQVYRNNFSGFNAALQSVDNNSGNAGASGLRMNCNDFTPASSMFDIAVLGNGTGLNAPSIKFVQGVAPALGVPSATSTVRNLYGAACGNQSKWYVAGAGTSTWSIIHGCNSNAVCQPTPQPVCSNTMVNIIAYPIVLTYSTACPAYPISNGGNGPTNPTTPNGILSNINQHIADLKAQGSEVDAFELESTLSSKISFYSNYADVASKDSIISIISTYSNNIYNSDVKLAFAYLNRQNYSMAVTKANALPANKSDWKNMLLKLSAIYQEPNKIYSICTNGSYRPFLQSCATATSAIDGQSIAQALLKFSCGVNYSEPRPLPSTGVNSRFMSLQEPSSPVADLIQTYPNPTQGGVTVKYNSQAKGTLFMEVKDLLGKVIYANFINRDETYVPLQDYYNGVYLISLSKGKEVIYTTKIVKQD